MINGVLRSGGTPLVRRMLVVLALLTALVRLGARLRRPARLTRDHNPDIVAKAGDLEAATPGSQVFDFWDPPSTAEVEEPRALLAGRWPNPTGVQPT